MDNTSKFTIGVDNSDAEKLKIGTNSDLSSPAITIDQTNSNVGIGTNSPTDRLTIADITAGGSDGIRLVDPTAPGYGGYFHFDDAGSTIKIGGITNNTFNNSLSIGRDNSNVVINDDGLSSDFRVEGDTNPNLLVVDGSQDNVGIGRTNPRGKVDVAGGMLIKNQDMTFNSGGGAGTVTESAALVFDEPSSRVLAIKSDGDGNLIGTTGDGNARKHRWTLGGHGASYFNSTIDIDYPTRSQLTVGSSGGAGAGMIAFRRGNDGAATGLIGWSSATEGNNFRIFNGSGGGMITLMTNSGGTSGIYYKINDDTTLMSMKTTGRFDVYGTAYKTTAGEWGSNSDARLKKEIRQIDGKAILKKMLQLKGVTYYWNDTKTGVKRPTELQYGFTAQNVQTVFPSMVTEDELGYLQTAYGTYDAMYVESMRALQQQIDAQQAVIQAQQQEINIQQSQRLATAQKLAELEAKIDALLVVR